MPNNLQETIDRLSLLRDQLQAKANQIRSINGNKDDGDVIDLIEMWGKVKDKVEALSLLQTSIEIQQDGIDKGIPDEDILKRVTDRLQLDMDSIDSKIKGTKRAENAATALLSEYNEKYPTIPPSSKTKGDIPTDQELNKTIADRTQLMDTIIANTEVAVENTQRDLMRQLVDGFVDKLDLDSIGDLKNTQGNKNMIGLLDGIFAEFNAGSNLQLVNKVIDGVSEILEFGGEYFVNFTEKGDLAKLMDTTKQSIEDWLGITSKGELVENGYMSRLLQDPTIRNEVQNSMFGAIIGGKGYNETKSDLSDYIQGNPTTTGALQQYYRNFVYDTFSQVDRTQAKIIGDKLGMTYAIYEGGIIKTTRPFCLERNGKVFSSEEIAAFDPPTAKQPNYNPFFDLGGYGCRHHLNYIPEIIAFSLRPDLAPVK